MKRLTIRDPATGTTVQASEFRPGQKGVREVYLCGFAPGEVSEQVLAARLNESYVAAVNELGLPPDSALFRRLHSGAPRTAEAALAGCPLARAGVGAERASVAIVGQPVSPEGGLGLFAYHMHGETPLGKEPVENGILIQRPGARLMWQAGLPAKTQPPAGTAEQTEFAFGACARELNERGGNVKDHLLRTWIFVDDIDRNYQPMSETRRELFKGLGLTSRTHYVVSTGIGGSFPEGRDIALDSWAAIGLDSRQVRYLEAPHLLSRTDLYGVTFERGAVVTFGDRRLVLLAGTASCSAEGETLHRGNCVAQLERSIENLEGLLAEAGGSFPDLAYLLAYVRNNEDGESVRSLLGKRLPDVPLLVVQGQVCRPEWLVEIEGTALLEGGDPKWLPF